MFVSYRWLEQYVNLNGISPQDLGEKITRSGIEVESVHEINKEIKGIVVGHVVKREKHPEADKLSKCLVDLGDGEPVQIICGASNVAEGQKVAVATVGAVLPGNFKIKKAKLRGEESNGMICSLSELGIEARVIAKDYSSGIFVFPNDVEVGKNAMEVLGFEDAILELGLTPNRADCLNMLGVAYEVAAILGEEVQLPKIEEATILEKTSDTITVKVEAKEANPLYIAKTVKNVKIGRSPIWMESCLMKAGIRPINNIVDITNFVLLEYGQPLHAFDYDKLNTKKILVRFANEGEKMVTLDDVERTLRATDLVITDGEKPVALAGVMGGSNSEVDETTKNVLLESAVFNRQTIRSTSKYVGIRSEASARYEKGIDMNRTLPAVERAAQLLALYAGGEVCDGTVEVCSLVSKATTVETSVLNMNRALGTNVPAEEVANIFSKLGFSYDQNGDKFTVEIPTRRMDISIEEDLFEEVGRLYGYDHIPSTLPVAPTSVGKLNRKQQLRRLTKSTLESCGLSEAITYSLTSETKSKAFSLYETTLEAVKLAMPMSEERKALRLSLIPHLLEVVAYNLNRKEEDVFLYEIGSAFLPIENEALPKEITHLAGAVTGTVLNHAWQSEKKTVDFFVLKGVLETLFEKLGISQSIVFKKSKVDGLHPGRTAQIIAGGKMVGVIGQIHPEMQKELGLKETYVFELDFSALTELEEKLVQYTPTPRFPAMTRDIALVVNKEVSHAELEGTILEAGQPLLESVSLFDIYMGDKLEIGKKSMAYSLKYLDSERTLTDEEVVRAHNKVLKALEEKQGAVLR